MNDSFDYTTGWLIFGINDILFTDYLQHLCKDIYSHIVFLGVKSSQNDVNATTNATLDVIIQKNKE